jgi:dUTP pyrophosphatase
MTVNFKLVHPNAARPVYSSDGAAGLDLVAVTREWDADNQVFIYDTGVAVEIPEGYVGLLFPRSSIYKTQLGLANSVGVIDSDFRGSIKVIFRDLNQTHDSICYKVGDRIAQLMIVPFPRIEVKVIDVLSETNRGNKGFGSTGK